MKYRIFMVNLFTCICFIHLSCFISMAQTPQESGYLKYRQVEHTLSPQNTPSGRTEYAMEQVLVKEPIEPDIMIVSPFFSSFSGRQESQENLVENHEPVLNENTVNEDDMYIFSITNRELTSEMLDISCVDSVKVEKQQQTISQQYENVPYIHQEQQEPLPSKVKVYRSTTALPLFYQQLGLENDTAPLPFAIMLFGNYMQTKVVTSHFQGSSLVQDVSLNLGGLGNISFGNFAMPLTGFADVTQVEQRFATGGARFAVNVLPFWSVYGLLAYSTGNTKSAVHVKNIYMRDVDLKANTGNPILDALINRAIQAMGNTLLVKEGTMPFVMDFDAFSTGIGTSLAIGGKLFFTAIDANYVITSVESANIIVHTVNASARIGMHKTYGAQQMAMWIGANYMENIAGSDKLGAVMSVEHVSDLFQLDGLAQSIVGNKPADIRWSVNQRPLNVFSALVGVRYSPRKNFDIVTEVGFIDRVNIMVSAAYNF